MEEHTRSDSFHRTISKAVRTRFFELVALNQSLDTHFKKGLIIERPTLKAHVELNQSELSHHQKQSLRNCISFMISRRLQAGQRSGLKAAAERSGAVNFLSDVELGNLNPHQ